MRSFRVSVAVALALALGACGGGGKSSTTPPVNPGGPRTLTGTVTYDFVPATLTAALDFAHATQKPVRNAVIQVMKGTTVLVAGQTDATGHYSLNFTESGTGQLAVVVLAKTAAMPVIQVVDNTDQTIWAIGVNLDGTQTTQDLHATHGWNGTAYVAANRTAAPFAILDSMYTAATAFVAARPAATFPPLPVNWSPANVPQGATAGCTKAQGCIGTSHFSPGENAPVGMIYILGKEGVDTDEFDTHVMVHEWGHYFEHNLSRSDSPGGPHGAGDVLDPRIAFGEGYGNALAAMLLPESVYVDTSWGSSGMRAFGFDANVEPPPSATSGANPADDPNPSVFSETSVMRFLWHAFDGGSGAAWDTMGVGLGVIYDVLTGPEKNTQALTTIGSFITGLKAQSGVNAGAVDTLAAHFNIGPITDEWGTGDANLAAMYVDAGVANTWPPAGLSGTFSLGGGFDYNKWEQNQYFRFKGSGASVTVTSTCAQDVDLKVFQGGQVVASAQTNSGNETVQVNAAAGKDYVVSLIGWGATPGNYNVTMKFTTP